MTGRRLRPNQCLLRLPDGLRDRIKAAADAASRSMNAEIIHVLEREYPADTPDVLAALEDLLGGIEDGNIDDLSEACNRAEAVIAQVKGARS